MLHFFFSSCFVDVFCDELMSGEQYCLSFLGLRLVNWMMYLMHGLCIAFRARHDIISIVISRKCQQQWFVIISLIRK